jgi:hypothetical protein
VGHDGTHLRTGNGEARQAEGSSRLIATCRSEILEREHRKKICQNAGGLRSTCAVMNSRFSYCDMTWPLLSTTREMSLPSFVALTEIPSAVDLMSLTCE